MLRLLYLWLRLKTSRQTRAPVRRLAPPRSRRAIDLLAASGAALAACVGVALIVAYARPDFIPAPLSPAATRAATLALRVDAVESAPIVVSLERADPGGRETQAHRDVAVRITSVNNAFEPRFQVAPVAASVEVGNRDPVPHNTHVFDGRRTLFNVAVPLSGVRVQKVLGRPGIFEVRCDFHPWMRAWLFVPSGPHHAVVWTPGEAALRDIPPGSYRLHVWTPAHGDTIRTLTFRSGEVKSLQLAGA
jgi:plastocyanin